MDNLSTNQKIALGVGAAAATVGAIAAALWLSKRGKDEELDEDEAEPVKVSKQQEKPKKGVDKVMEAQLEKAAELRSEGNKAFTNKQYDEAIRLYTEALALSDLNAHLLYSNRSAAFLFKGEHEQAIADAQKCLDLKPDWSKAYFRMGKALMAATRFDDAFKQFYKGTLVDKSSDELRVLLEQCSRTLGICEKDSRAHIEKEMVKLYSKEQCEHLCNTVLNIPYETVRQILESSIKDGTVSSLLENETIEKCVADHPVETYRVLAEILLELDKADEAHVYSTKAYEARPNDPQVLLLLVTTMLRSATGGIDTYGQAFEYMREALRIAPDNVQIVHTYASILLQQSTVGVRLPAPVRTLLSELKKGLDNPNANHLLVADSGMRLWFKLLEEHTNELIAEEQRNVRNQTPPDEAYIYGLTQGAFSKVCLEPFFQQALSQVVFSNPGLETVLVPFRSAFTSLKVGSTFDQLAPFIHALALQCYRNNYSWITTPEDQKRLEELIEAVNSKLATPPDTLVIDGALDPELYHHLSIISLFQPLHSLNGLSTILQQVDKARVHEWFLELMKKVYWNYEEEARIKAQIQPITPIPDDSIVSFYNKCIPVWDSAGLAAGRLTTVTVGQEMQWMFKNYQPRNLDGTVKMFVAGCGSGGEVYQYTTFYKNAEITAVDISVDRLAYAIRQHQDLGISNIKFFLADVTQLTPANFPEQFDVVVANGLLHHLADPFKGWDRLAAILKPGGLLKMSLYSARFIELLEKTRTYLNKTQQFSPNLFTNDSPLPLLKRTPTLDDVRNSRNLILACEEKDLEDLKELVTSPQFYALDEFTELVFHPQILGFSFSVIGDCLTKLGLKLVGFEFPGIGQETYLKYCVEFPEDLDMKNIKNLEAFSKKHPDAFKNYTHTINFVAEKPLK
jgi:tetratricopeptide (TPR) repeat protein